MEKKYIALTFDDGPTIGITDDVLDILEKNNAKASFFLIGNQINEETKYLIERAYKMGCSIENHSYTHPSMPSLTDEEILNEISVTTEKIISVTNDRPVFFRPPYIDFNQKMFDLIDLYFIRGYGCFDWDMSVSKEERVSKILEDTKAGNIILLHDMENNVNTVEALKEIIPILKSEGYEFVNIRELFDLYHVEPERNRLYSHVNEYRIAED